jgi:hypothetical protein
MEAATVTEAYNIYGHTDVVAGANCYVTDCMSGTGKCTKVVPYNVDDTYGCKGNTIMVYVEDYAAQN